LSILNELFIYLICRYHYIFIFVQNLIYFLKRFLFNAVTTFPDTHLIKFGAILEKGPLRKYTVRTIKNGQCIFWISASNILSRKIGLDWFVCRLISCGKKGRPLYSKIRMPTLFFFILNHSINPKSRFQNFGPSLNYYLINCSSARLRPSCRLDKGNRVHSRSTGSEILDRDSDGIKKTTRPGIGPSPLKSFDAVV
jgi:hypothetical protein